MAMICADNNGVFMRRVQNSMSTGSEGLSGNEDCVYALEASAMDGMDETADCFDTDISDLSDADDMEADPLNIKGHASDNGVEDVYKKACLTLKVVPCSPFLRNIHKDEIDISHYNVGPTGAAAIAKAMQFHAKTTFLNISDNGIGSKGCVSFAEMLSENRFITVLDLSMNFIGREGVAAICGVLGSGKCGLIELSLASNRLGDASARSIADAVKENRVLRMLNLSSNDIGTDYSETGGLASALAANKCLLYIDLSCNHIRSKCARRVFDAVKNNAALRYVNLSGNGIANDAAVSLKSMLADNGILRELDLSRNRFTVEAAKDIGIGLEKNTAMTTFHLSGNPLGSRGATIIIEALTNDRDHCLEELYLNNIDVSWNFESALDELFVTTSSSLYVEYGTLFRGAENLKRKKEQKDLISRILDFIEYRGMRVLDFFRTMDKNGRLLITKEEFKKGLRTAAIPMRSCQVDRLFDLLDVEGTGHARYRDFVKFINKDFHATFAKARRNHQWNH
eukprot:gene10079-11109_t